MNDRARYYLAKVEIQLDIAAETMSVRLDSDYTPGVIRQEIARTRLILRELLKAVEAIVGEES